VGVVVPCLRLGVQEIADGYMKAVTVGAEHRKGAEYQRETEDHSNLERVSCDTADSLCILHSCCCCRIRASGCVES